MASIKRIVEKTWLAAFVVVALVFVVSFFQKDRDKILEILRADFRFLGLAMIAQLCYFVAAVNTWQRALSYATHRSVSFLEGCSQLLLLNFGKYIPGKVWGLAARGARLGQLGYRLEEIGNVSYLEQFLLVLAGFWLAFLAATVLYGEPVYIALLVLTTLALILFRHSNRLATWLAAKFPKTLPIERILGINITYVQQLALISGYVLVWSLLTLTFILVCASLAHIDLTMTNVTLMLLSLTAGYLAGFIAVFAPGGVGVREGVGAALLTSIVTLEEAVLLMLLFRVWTVAWELAGGFIVVSARSFSTRVHTGD